MHRTRSVVAASVILTLGFSSFAVARNGDPVTQGKRNGTTTSETEIISNINGTTAKTGGYSTRQSNKSNSGGGAIYGCRSAAGGPENLPCVRANNLSSGKAFEFNATSGPVAGTIVVGGGGDTKKPFTTNATGVADGLNADRVDGLNADQIVAAAREGNGGLRTRYALVDERGVIVEQSGGFTVTSAYGRPNAGNNPNVYIDAGESLVDNGLQVSIAGQNRVNRSDQSDGPEPNFGGSVSIARCGTEGANATTCAPEGTNNPNTIVVAPRVPTSTEPGQPVAFASTEERSRIRFYVLVTE